MNATDWTDFTQKILSALFGIIGTWLALNAYYQKKHQETLDRYATGKQKEYAAERDFQHLKRNQEQMQEALKLLDEEVSDNREDVKEIKGMMISSFGRSGESGFFGKQEKRN